MGNITEAIRFAPAPLIEEQPILEAAEQGRVSDHYNKVNMLVRRGGALVLGSLAIGGITSPAEAATVTNISYGQPVVTTEKYFSTNPAQIIGNVDIDNVQATIAGESQSSSSRVTILSYNRVSGIPKRYVRRETCKWVNDGYNSGVTINSSPSAKRATRFFRDRTRTYICKVPTSLSYTGWMKAGHDKNRDGVRDSGSNCGNIFSPISRKPREIIKTPVIMFPSALNLKLFTKAKATIFGNARCEDARGYSEAEFKGTGEGYAAVKVTSRVDATTRGNIVALASGSAITNAEADARGYAVAVCKDETVPSPPPTRPPSPPPVNHAPIVDLIGPQHVIVDDREQICGYVNDVENDIVSVAFSEVGNGNFVTPNYAGDEPGEVCRDYIAGTTPDNARVTLTAVDSANNIASDNESFPIEARPGGFRRAA
ncbi:MAG: hypothetical protein JWO35_825 [Candidatus Saccharibacteria bacterium]|nr:hypothetical protein [Candidatus Saccharibacteria bacterium]